jgi:dTDP-4-dehydrorhamnose 3,5-epimerase
MIFTETRLKGVFEIELEVHADERGFFARSYCAREFEARGLSSRVVQCNISHNGRRGTVRGMHYQQAPYQESKLIRCVRGAVYDVVIDLRADSATFREWVGVELRAGNRQPSRMLYVPEGFAHGFQTLEDDTEIFYQMSEFHSAESARGYRWNDPAFLVTWPEPVSVISERDRTYPDFAGAKPQSIAP